MDDDEFSWKLASSDNMWLTGVQGPTGAQGVVGAVGSVGANGPAGSWYASDTKWLPLVHTIQVDGKVYSYTDAQLTDALTEIKEFEILAEEFPQINHALKHLRAMVKLHKAE